jgi:hypothetical protein
MNWRQGDMRNKRRFGIAVLLASLMMMSTIAFLPTASAATPYQWRDYEYPIQPYFGTGLWYKMYTVDYLDYQLPTLKYYANQGVFHPDFLVSYMKIMEFMYRSCDPDLWWFQDEMYIYTQLYGNYPGDSNKPIPQAAVSQAKKVFQDEYVVIVELNSQIRKLDSDYQTSTGMNQLMIYSMMLAYKSIRNNMIVADMVMAYHILDMSNSMVDAIENSNGVVDLSPVGGPSDFTLENQQQILKWTDQANNEFDAGVTGLGLTPSDVRYKIDTNQQYLIAPMLSTELDPSAYTSAMKAFEKTLNGAGHALAVSGGLDFCMNSFVLVLPAVVGIVLCVGVYRKRRRNA